MAQFNAPMRIGSIRFWPPAAFITYAMAGIALATCRRPMIEDIPEATRKAQQGADDDLDEVRA
jgi:hypothetical protein